MATKKRIDRRIKDSSTTFAKVGAEEVARAIGATRAGSVPRSAERYPSLITLQRRLREELVSEGGRPRRDGAVVTRRVPLTSIEARALDAVTEEVRQGGVNVTSGQVAGYLLREKLDGMYGDLVSLKNGPEVRDPIAELTATFDQILAAAASAKEELEALRPVAKELLEKMKAGRGIESEPASD